jgi:hypothetical protein
MKKILRKPYSVSVKIAKKILSVNDILAENEYLKSENRVIAEKLDEYKNAQPFGWPNGHYYSPVHEKVDLKNYKKVVSKSKRVFSESIPGFSEQKILKRFKEIKIFFKDFNYPKNDDGISRFYSNNVSLSLLDSLVIFSMIRKNMPKRIIEIGSGFSSGLMMEVNEKYFGNKIDLTFIEPYPELLYERMQKKDKPKYTVIPSAVQNVPLDVFKKLKKDDILFIDSTHVSKFNSDVNYEIFNILPVISKGVIIHFHDIHDGFEYPLDWLERGWAWNESYLLRAFLMNNNDYEVLIANNFIKSNHPSLLSNLYSDTDRMYSDTGKEIIKHDGSIWLRKV